MSQSKVTFFVKVFAKSGAEKELESALAALISPTREEPGCVQYVLHSAQDNPKEFVIYESWRSPEDLERHVAMPHFQSFIASAGPLLDAPPVRWMLNEIS